jgi:Fic family protein
MTNVDIMEQIILDRMRAKLLERTNLNTLPESIWKQIAALNTWGTNAIEGSTITRKDADQILLDNRTPSNRPIRDVMETVQHERTFRDLIHRQWKDITLETVLELHEEVFRLVLPDAGHWRRVNVRIRGAKFTPPRLDKVVNEMEKWVKDYRQEDLEGKNVFSLGSIMHFNFERIHPFSDGNGRVGRLLLNLHLLKRNWPPVHVLPAHRSDYLNALNRAAKDEFNYLENLLRILMGASLLDLLDQVGTMDDELISLKAASAITPYSKKYLALRCKQGELPSLLSGRQWRTSKWALELYSEHVGRKKGGGKLPSGNL